MHIYILNPGFFEPGFFIAFQKYSKAAYLPKIFYIQAIF